MSLVTLFASFFCLCLLSSSLAQDCRKVVTHSSTHNNNDCKKLCESKSSKLNSHCHVEDWKLLPGDRLIPLGECFTNYVYGLTDIDHHLFLDYIIDVESPAACQQLCQDNPGCIHFMYREIVASSGPEVAQTHGCSLKSVETIEGAFSINPDKVDETLCDPAVLATCPKYLPCLSCAGRKKPCVWKSGPELTGPKYCPPTKAQDECMVPTLFPSMSTPAPPPAPASAKAEDEVSSIKGDSSSSEDISSSTQQTKGTVDPTDTDDDSTTTSPANTLSFKMFPFVGVFSIFLI